MHTYRTSRAQKRLWALLTIAFVIVGLSAGAALLSLSVDRYQTDYKRELKSVASLAALAVDPRAHEALRYPSQMTSPLYRREVAKLAEIQSRLTDIRYIYTLAKTEAGYAFILDPTPPGDHDQDGVDNKSYLGDDYPGITSAAKTCFARGIVTVESEPTEDKWGTFVSAYAPIFGDKGKVVGVLGIDRHANDFAEHQRDLRNVTAGGIILTVLGGLFLGWFFSRKMVESKENRGWLRYVSGSNLIFRVTILEVLLGCLALTVFLGAVQNLSLQGRLTNRVSQVAQDILDLDRMKAHLEHASVSQGVTDSEIQHVREIAQAMDIGWIYARLTKVESAERLGLFQQLPLEIDARILPLQQEMAGTRVRLGEAQRNLAVMFFISAFLALGALMVVRTASIHHQDLVAAQTDSEWHQVAYRQLVESLPIGLFMVTDGRISFSNQTWDAQCQREPDADRLQALCHLMTEADRDAFIKTIRFAEARRTSFETTYKLQIDGKSLSLETRGVPLLTANGDYECLLCFSNDVSLRVRNQEILKGKNREVQSKNRMLSRAVSLLEDNFEAMTQTLVKAVEAKDIYTAGHSERVMKYSLAIGRVLKLSVGDMKTLEIGTLIHDIGKIGIPDSVLTKPGQLTHEEYEVIQNHALNGARMVENIPVFQECVPIIRWHHERLNGSGYPDGLMGKEIPLLVRIASVADVFDAVTSNRAYRAAMNVSDAIDVLRTMANAGELDPELVEILAEIVMKEGVFGLTELSQVA